MPDILERDVNLAKLNVELMQTYEVHTKNLVHTENEKLAQYIALMEDFERFMHAFEKDQDNNGAVDWRQKQERIVLVQKIREQIKDSFPEMFPEPDPSLNNPNDVYTWDKDEAKTLMKHVNNFIDHIQHNKISQTSEHILQHEQNLSKATEIFAPFIKRMNNFIERILANVKAR